MPPPPAPASGPPAPRAAIVSAMDRVVGACFWGPARGPGGAAESRRPPRGPGRRLDHDPVVGGPRARARGWGAPAPAGILPRRRVCGATRVCGAGARAQGPPGPPCCGASRAPRAPGAPAESSPPTRRVTHRPSPRQAAGADLDGNVAPPWPATTPRHGLPAPRGRPPPTATPRRHLRLASGPRLRGRRVQFRRIEAVERDHLGASRGAARRLRGPSCCHARARAAARPEPVMTAPAN
jgi:hypothetical protein